MVDVDVSHIEASKYDVVITHPEAPFPTQVGQRLLDRLDFQIRILLVWSLYCTEIVLAETCTCIFTRSTVVHGKSDRHVHSMPSNFLPG